MPSGLPLNGRVLTVECIGHCGGQHGPELLQQDGVHLLDRGSDLFLKDIQGEPASGTSEVGWRAWNLALLVPMLLQAVQREQVSVSPLTISR